LDFSEKVPYLQLLHADTGMSNLCVMLDSITEIKPGMIVKLKGRVIPMSVHAVEEHAICCYWFSDHKLHKADFSHKELIVLGEEVNAHSILAGHVVRLKSGSPLMTVERIEFKKNKPHAVCSWQADRNHYLKKFNSLALEKIEG
jgi:uncharacterized protein YodC (DUF2158 family)